jgi:hypothetical protein
VSSHESVDVLFLVVLLHHATFVSGFVAEGDWIDRCAVAVDGQFGALVMQVERVRLPIFELLVVAVLQSLRTLVPLERLQTLPRTHRFLPLRLEVTLLLVDTGVVPLEPLQR